MPLRIRFAFDSGFALSFSVERVGDGTFFDFTPAVLNFAATPGQPTAALPEDAGIYRGRYKLTLNNTPAATWTDGAYTITVFDVARLAAGQPAVVAQLGSEMRGGDDQPIARTPLVQVGTVTLANGSQMPIYGPAGAAPATSPAPAAGT